MYQNEPVESEKPIRIIRYRPHIRWAYYLGVVALVGLFLSAVLLGLLLFLTDQFDKSQLVDMMVALLVLGCGLLFFFVYQVMRPMAFSEFFVFHGRLEIKGFGKLKMLPFDDLEGVEFSSLPYMGGWFSLLFKNKIDNKKKYRFTIALERSERLLDAIFSCRPDLINEEKFNLYRHTAVYADHAWARFHSALSQWRTLLFKYLVYPVLLGAACAYVIGEKSGASIHGGFAVSDSILVFYANLGFCYFIAAVFYLLQELIFGVRLRGQLLKNPKDLMRNVQNEGCWANRLSALYYVVTILWAFIFVASMS